MINKIVKIEVEQVGKLIMLDERKMGGEVRSIVSNGLSLCRFFASSSHTEDNYVQTFSI